MPNCPVCCAQCDDHGYIRDAVFDEDTNRLVPVDYRCDCRGPRARPCFDCELAYYGI
ncbi:hypothetical protein [Streptomyces sp. NPDC058657]|uniref:hypothetical protein n=1 Tax=unclassified Streptomyces TaxID=2593676 RepID=UPI0036522883